MISCSRPGEGALPANLQGLWLYELRPAWRCDYHTDINVQMNYWFTDQANISECFTPLAEWVESIRDVRKEETQKVLGVKRGWLMRSENNIFGGSTYYFQKGDSAWISQNLWDHYAFTQDKEYLKRYAYPVMKEISEFWLFQTVAHPSRGQKNLMLSPMTSNFAGIFSATPSKPARRWVSTPTTEKN
jgi:alpha-L-fucosidase 2